VIHFVSNLPHDLRSGGFSGISAASFDALRKLEPAVYVGPIDPPFVWWEKALSKAARTAGGRGAFSFFSERRLQAIARAVRAGTAREARLDFFHGFTPWIAARPERPYLALGDCTFHDYVDIYHRREEFDPGDLERIERSEAAWLRGARRVLFTSAWAAERARGDYGLASDRIGVVGSFGEIEPPERDDYSGGAAFLFVSTSFAAKGGPVVVAALREVRRSHPEASLVVVGDRPAGFDREPGLSFAGFLRKEVPEEKERFRALLAAARALVHPTRSDIAPLIVVEAGYFGCPAIASRRFAIPGLVDDGRSGILLADPSRADEVARAMTGLLEDEAAYRAMRSAAWDKARGEHSKARFEERLIGFARGDAPE
jgi:glycosyltransferase involved in cell wall biosynthesis